MTPPSRNGGETPRLAETGHVQFLPLCDIRPAPVNDSVYKPISLTHPDEDLRELARSVAERGILEPIVVTEDFVILSGHRRYGAAHLAGLTKVPVRVQRGLFSTSSDFLTLLVSFNSQREKTLDQQLREQNIKAASPEEAHRNLVEYRRQQARINDDEVVTVPIEGRKTRSEISEAKWPFLRAVQAALKGLDGYLPVSVRQIHYQLLNDPPLTHAGKPDSRYANNLKSYKQLSDILTRARLAGFVSMSAIADETRPVFLWDVHPSAAAFIQQERESFLRHYQRDLQQSQPNHIEIIGEKNTLTGIIKPVAANYGIPYTTGRGFCSTPPKHEMAQRFFRSGKEKLILLSLSDFDPEGEEITHSFARDLRDEHGVRKIEPVKVALTHEQVQRLGLVPSMEAKTGSTNHDKFVAKYGKDVFELESVAPPVLQRMLAEAIDSVMDVQAYKDEIAAEKEDAANIDRARQRAIFAMSQGQGEGTEQGQEGEGGR